MTEALGPMFFAVGVPMLAVLSVVLVLRLMRALFRYLRG